MTTRIAELTEKIYNEGISKAREDGELIISDARKQAEEIIQSSRTTAKEIIETAEKQSSEIKENTNAELKLAANQFISSLKQQILNLVTSAQVGTSVRDAFKDKTFIKNIILSILENWDAQRNEALNISLLLPQEDEEKLNQFFKDKAIEALNAGLEISFVSDIKSGFRIGPKDGNYYISFSDKDFENYFKKYLKERTKKMLFDPDSS